MPLRVESRRKPSKAAQAKPTPRGREREASKHARASSCRELSRFTAYSKTIDIGASHRDVMLV